MKVKANIFVMEKYIQTDKDGKSYYKAEVKFEDDRGTKELLCDKDTYDLIDDRTDYEDAQLDLIVGVSRKTNSPYVMIRLVGIGV